ncbi:hypothetical protein BGZ76_001065 [Entomortierella beljakovae]|nr:hypothetical protein BGZ76_001065 [Entomortierella beljakovae]
MHISKLILPALLGVIFLSSTLALHTIRTESSDISPSELKNKRDLLGNLLPMGQNPQNGSPEPVSSSNTPGSSPSTNNPTTTSGSNPIPSLFSDVLGSPSSSASSSAPTTQPKKKPGTTSADGTDPSQGTAGGDPNSPAPTGKSNGESSSSGLAPIIFSCYKIRQSRRRRHESWTENILKNHTGGVGYTEGGGYGMYVGNGGYGKDRPDIW